MPFVPTIPATAHSHEHNCEISPTLPLHLRRASATEQAEVPGLTMATRFDYDNHRDDVSDDASTFTFHPVDAPELEVIVSRIFSISFTTRQVPSPIAVSDEEDLTSESGEDWFLTYCEGPEEHLSQPDSSISWPIDAETHSKSDHDSGRNEDFDSSDSEEDEYENRKRKEDASLDEEQLRKKRRIEEEERKARNDLWKKSLKRSMFEHMSPLNDH